MRKRTGSIRQGFSIDTDQIIREDHQHQQENPDPLSTRQNLDEIEGLQAVRLPNDKNSAAC